MKYQSSLEQLSQNGYAVFRRVLPVPKVVDLHRHAASWLARYLTDFMALRGIQDQAELIARANQLSKNEQLVKQLSGEEQKTYSGGFPLEFRLSEEVRAFICTPELLELAQVLLGTDAVAAHMPPMGRFIHPGNTSAKVPAHIDLQYNDYLQEFYTIWIPLQNVDQQLGGVNIFCDAQGRANRIVPDTGNDIDNHFWQREISPQAEFTARFQALNAGDVLVFDKNVLHESAGNNSQDIRFSLDMRVFESWRDTQKHKIILAENRIIPEPPHNPRLQQK